MCGSGSGFCGACTPTGTTVGAESTAAMKFVLNWDYKEKKLICQKKQKEKIKLKKYIFLNKTYHHQIHRKEIDYLKAISKVKFHLMYTVFQMLITKKYITSFLQIVGSTLSTS